MEDRLSSLSGHPERVSSGLLGAFITGSFSYKIATDVQGRAQERSDSIQQKFYNRSNDIDLARLIIDIQDREDPKLYIYLPYLVRMLTEPSLANSFDAGIATREDVPVAIKQDVSTSAQKVASPSIDSTCAIFYLKGDSQAKEDAKAIKDFLLNKRKSRFQEYPFIKYPLVAKDTSWYVTNFPYSKDPLSIYKDLLIYYNNPVDVKLETRLYYALKEGIFGIVYTESFSGGWERNLANKGNGVLRGRFFEDVNGLFLGEPEKKLQDYDIAIVIPPRFNAAILDTVYFPNQ